VGCFELRLRRLSIILPTTSSRFIVDFACLRRWPRRHGPALELGRFGSPLGNLREAEGRKSGVTMNTLPLLIFIGSAGMLFGTSNMLPNADAAMNAPLRRAMMQAIVSLAVLAASLFIILTHRFDPAWAYGTVGMVVGYWLKFRLPATSIR